MQRSQFAETKCEACGGNDTDASPARATYLPIKGSSNMAFNENLRRLMRLTHEMLALADEGDRDRDDDSCGILYGILRDTAYRLRHLTQEECSKHQQTGKWDLETTNESER